MCIRDRFSDVLTLLLALDCDVELYKGGIMSIQEFAKLKRDNDILVHIIICLLYTSRCV